MLNVYSFKKLDYDQLTNYNVCISVSLFKMSDPYRNFTKYVKGFLDWIYTIPSNIFVRLYTDEASLMSTEFQSIINKEINHLEIFVYDYPEFKTSNKDFHDGTFGTLMRFLPLWDKELWNKYKINFVWVSDVDVYPAFLNNDILEAMKLEDAKVAYYSKACYNKPWVPDSMDFSIGAGKIIFSKTAKISEFKFKKFLADILEKKYKFLYNKIRDYYKNINDDNTLKSILRNKYITYGFDEYYCNVILYSDIKNYKTIVQYNLDLSGFSYIYNIPNKSELKTLERNLWTGIDKNNSKFKDYTDKVYNFLLTQDLGKIGNRYKMCLEDYGKYNSNIKKDSNILGVFLVVN
jgi:hypothetical protein